MQSSRLQIERKRAPTAGARRGAITVWLILAIPAVVTLLCVVAEIGNLWLARVELTNSLEAAALGAVKQWGDAGGGSTLVPRQVGNAYASANTLNGTPVDLTLIDPALNRDPTEPCNENACGDGVLVFGAIIDNDPEFVFDCCATPSCGVGTILFDASGQGTLGTANNNEWGIRYLDEPIVPPGLLIVRVRITLTGGASFIPGTFGLADLVPPFKVVDTSALTPDAPDLFGLTAAQITPAFLAGNTVLEFTFGPAGPDTGFQKGDRFRFGVDVDAPGPGVAQFNGDQVGQPGTQAQILVEFSDSSIATGALVDTQFGGQFGPPPPDAPCQATGVFDPAHLSLSVFPRPNLIPDLPCPPAAAANNDGQSFVELHGGGGGFNQAYAVRAHATYQVPSICCELFGVPIGPFEVTACADALYDCTARTPRLYHLEDRNFQCGVVCP